MVSRNVECDERINFGTGQCNELYLRYRFEFTIDIVTCQFLQKTYRPIKTWERQINGLQAKENLRKPKFGRI